MLGDRPAYRFDGRRPVTVFADRPELLAGISFDQARDLARHYATDAPSLQARELLASPDQWTLQLLLHFPLYRFSLGDDRGTDIYVSSKTGDLVMRTTRRQRVLAYFGPIPHWLYWPTLRRHGAVWTRVIVWSSILGCVLCLSGLVIGALRFSPTRAFRARGQPARSPYTGWMQWHHYAGLSVGIVTFTWTFSGLLSMDPFPALSSEGVTAAERTAVSGIRDVRVPDLPETTDALRVASRSLAPKRLELIWFGGAPYWLATGDGGRSVLVSATPPHAARERFGRAQIEEAARAAASTPARVELEWLDEYDEYYYDRDERKPLPVLRARYGDAHRTWMYLDPSRGAIALVVRDRDRLNRWLYHGLHSFDPAWLRNRRPLRDLLMVGLMLAGIVGVAASLVPAWRRVRSSTPRISRRGR
jgi:uncharacterized iron-regulated membrane protein